MAHLKSLFEVLWRPEVVMRRDTVWFVPYIASVVCIGLLGLYTNYRIGSRLSLTLQELGVSMDGIALFQRGSYIGIVVVACVLPIAIPWVASLISKFVGMFSGSRVTFSEFFLIYQWAYYISTLIAATLKAILFMNLPVDAWGGISLSLAALIPEWNHWFITVGATLDLSILIFFAVAFLGLKARQRKKDWSIPIWTFLAFVVVQVSITA